MFLYVSAEYFLVAGVNRDQKYYAKMAEAILSRFPEEDRRLVESFLDSLDGVSVATVKNIVDALSSFRRMVGKPLEKVEERDARAWIRELRKTRKLGTVNVYGGIVKRFYNWLGLPVLHFFKRRPVRGDHREKLIDKETLEKIFSSIDNLKIKALIGVMWEGALRSAEVRFLRIRDVMFERELALLRVNGKTGQRTVPIYKTAPWLHMWLTQHPLRDDPDAYVFIVAPWKPYPYAAVSLEQMVRRLGKKVGAPDLHPHMFRHTRLTELAKHLTEQELKLFAGWIPDSRMAGVYVHLSGRDARDAIMRIYGLREEERKEEVENMKPVVCPRCGTPNPHEAKACFKCALILDDKLAWGVLRKKQQAEDILLRVLKHPKVRETIIEALRELEGE